ncbi:MAG: ABC transporter permease [Caldilineaceae bacterium]|nr:ABC transporter permease [Caldilineaceae bacterium]
MLAYILRRLIAMIPLLFLVSIITFVIIQLPPGDYFTSLQAMVAETGGGGDARTYDILRLRYGLDQPIHVQYLKWIQGFPEGDFGWSLEWNSPVWPLVRDRLNYTILLGTLSLLITISYAIPVGIYSATHQYSFGDNALSFFGFLGLSLPGFLLALVWLFVGAIVLRIDVGGVIATELRNAPLSWEKIWSYWNHLWPPAIILGLASTAQLQRIMRSSLLDVMGQQYITTARAKGLRERDVVMRYGVRVAINPLISVLALEIPKIISESALVGIVMSLPTTGPLFLRALQTQDMYLAGTFLLFMTLILMVANLIADVLLAAVDPRIAYQ